MVSNIEFSVLMAVYKNDDPIFFDNALRSILSSTITPNEICLVVDGPIPDEIESVLNVYVNKIPLNIIRLKENKGLGIALSIGLLACKHEWIARFDSDDICYIKRFEKQLNFIEKYPEIDIFSSWISEFTDDINHPISVRKIPQHHSEILKYAKNRNPFNHMAVMYKKRSVLAAGNYQNDYLYEDYALWVRMIMNGCKTANIVEPLVYVRVGNGMMARRGGIKYLKSEFNVLNNFRKIGFLTLNEFISNIMIRAFFRLIPTLLRGWLYKCILR